MKCTDKLNDEDFIESVKSRYIVKPNKTVYDLERFTYLKPTAHKQGYTTFWIFGRKIMFHRLYYAVNLGPINGVIDHIDGDNTNDRLSNLRDCGQSQNTANSRIRSDNTSGYTGVIWHKASGRWQAQTMKDGKRVHIGLFTDPKEAALAYNHKIESLFGRYCTFNQVF